MDPVNRRGFIAIAAGLPAVGGLAAIPVAQPHKGFGPCKLIGKSYIVDHRTPEEVRAFDEEQIAGLLRKFHDKPYTRDDDLVALAEDLTPILTPYFLDAIVDDKPLTVLDSKTQLMARHREAGRHSLVLNYEAQFLAFDMMETPALAVRPQVPDPYTAPSGMTYGLAKPRLHVRGGIDFVPWAMVESAGKLGEATNKTLAGLLPFQMKGEILACSPVFVTVVRDSYKETRIGLSSHVLVRGDVT